MFSWLKGATQGANFPYDVKEVVSSYEGKSIWKLQNGEKKVSVVYFCNNNIIKHQRFITS